MSSDILSGIYMICELIRKRKYEEARIRIQQEQEQFKLIEVCERRRQIDTLIQSIIQIDHQIHLITQQIANLAEHDTKELHETLTQFLIQLKIEKTRLLIKKRTTSKVKYL